MQQIEVISWNTLDALKHSATKIIETIGDLDTNEQMAVFCCVEEDYLELYYSEVDSNYIRHFEDEDEFFKYIGIRKSEFGEEEFESMEFYDDDEGNSSDSSEDDFNGFNIRDENEDDEY